MVPGPGNYNINSSINAPQYSMSGRYNQGNNTLGSKSKVVPGPGAYDPTILSNSASGIKIGTGKRNKINQGSEDVPGPGNYLTTSQIAGNSYGFGTGNRSKLKSD